MTFDMLCTSVFFFIHFSFMSKFLQVLPTMHVQVTDHAKPKQEYDEYNNLYSRMEYIEGEDEELSWFNAGVRVGVGIGLSICVGIGIGAGLLARTYQGTTRNFRRRLL